MLPVATGGGLEFPMRERNMRRHLLLKHVWAPLRGEYSESIPACLGSLKRGSILRVYLNYKNKKLNVKKFIKLQKESGNKVDFNTAQYQRARGKKD